MKKNVKRIFFIQVIAFSIVVLAIAYGMFYALSVRNAEQRVKSAFRSELELFSNNLQYEVRIAREKVKALSSRTMIRKQLHAYYLTESTLEEVRTYTQPKYVDGSSVYDNILYALRIDRSGIRIAEYKAGLGTFPVQEKCMTFTKTGNFYTLCVRNEIIHNGTHIGNDYAVFKLDSTAVENALYFKEYAITDTAGSSNAVPIGETGWYLQASLDEDILRKEKRDIIKHTLLLSLLLIAAVVVVSYFTILRGTVKLINERDENNRKLSEAVEQKDYLLKEMNHRIKNNLMMVQSLISLKEVDSGGHADFSGLHHQIEAIRLVHEKLYQSDDITRIDSGLYIRDLLETVFSSLTEKQVHLESSIISIPLYTKTAVPLGLIINEIAVNAVKHGYTGIDDCGFTVAFQSDKAGEQFALTLANNGAPFPRHISLENPSSLGLRLISALVRQLEGTIELQREPHPEFVIRFPVDE